MSDAVLVALLAGLFGGGGLVTTALLVWQQRRGTDGSVRATPAEALWQALNRAREQQAEENREMRAEIARLRDALSAKDVEVLTLRRANHEQQMRIEELENEIDELRAELGAQRIGGTQDGHD